MDDLYEDLENYDDVNVIEELKNENKELKLQIEKYSTTMAQLQKDFDKLTSEYQKLEKNYSSLLKTARAEIERKADIIKTLNTEKDMLVIRSLQKRNGNILKPQRSNSNDRQSNIGRSSNLEADKLKQNESTDNSHKNNRLDSVRMSSVETVSTTSIENKSTSSDSKYLKDIHNNETMIKSSHKTTKKNHKENIEQKVVTKKIVSRRKSMPATNFQISKFSSDEEGEVFSTESIRKSPVRQDYRDNRIDSRNYHESRDFYRRNNNHGDSGYRYGDRYDPMQRFIRQYSPEQNYRYASDSSQHPNYRHRLRKSPPPNKYNRSKSRDRRYMDNHRDNDRYYPHYERDIARKSKARSDYDEPSNKRQKLESYKNFPPQDNNYMNNKEKEMYERLHDIQEDSCQSPDYIHDTHVPQHNVKEIKYTSSTYQEDPRISSKKYVLQTSKDKEYLSTTASRTIEIKYIDTSEWDIEKVEIPEALRKRPSEERKESETNELINQVYMNYENSELESLESGKIEIEDDAVISNLTKNLSKKETLQNCFDKNTNKNGTNELDVGDVLSFSNINNLNENNSLNDKNNKIKNHCENKSSHDKTKQKNKNDNSNKLKLCKDTDVTENFGDGLNVNNEKSDQNKNNCDNKSKSYALNTRELDSEFCTKNIEKSNDNKRYDDRNSKIKQRKVTESSEKDSDCIIKNTDKQNEKKNNRDSSNKTKNRNTSGVIEHRVESSDKNNLKINENVKKPITSHNDNVKHEDDLLKLNIAKVDESNSRNLPRTKYKIPKVKKPDKNDKLLENESDENPKAFEFTSTVSKMETESPHNLNLKGKTKTQNIKEHCTEEIESENNGNELQKSNRSKPLFDKSIQEILATVKGDLELSDDDEITEFQKQIFKEGIDKQSNAVVITDIVKTSSTVKGIKLNLPTCAASDIGDTKECLKIKKSSSKESTREIKKRRCKRKISESHNVITEEPKMKQTNTIGSTNHKETEQKISQPKTNKFSDLFGDSNSLITPDDLGIPVSQDKIKSNVKNLSIFDNTEDAVDMSIEDITKGKNTAGDKIVCEKVVRTAGTINEVSNNEIKNNDANFQIYENIVAETSTDLPNVVKTVIISTGGVLDMPPDVAAAPNVNYKIEAVKCLNDVGALATSTPYKNIEFNTFLPNNDASGSYVKDKEVNCSSNSTQSTELHNSKDPIETDAPDVRIFVRRRRKIIKKST